MERINWPNPTRANVIEASPIVSLDLIHGDSVWTFDFGVDGRDAVVVGSDPEADVCIDAPGVAPLHFHFERAGVQIALVSGYGKDVRLDAVPMRGVRSVVDLSLIEFGSASLGVRIRQIARSAHLYSSPQSGSERAAPHSASRAVFEAPTVDLEVPRRCPDEGETAALPLRAQLFDGGRPAERTSGEDQYFPTEEMVMRFDWDSFATQGEREEFRVELPTLGPVREIQEDRACAARYVEGPAPAGRASSGRAPAGRAPAGRAWWFVGIADWLEELGLLAKARPVAVTIVVAVVAFVSSLALVGVRSVMSGLR